MSGHANSNGHRWSKFWWQDWQNDRGLRLCSLSARGLWMEMLCTMHEADGYLLVGNQIPTTKQMARMYGITPRECEKLLAELEENLVFSRTDGGTIYSRRMVRDIRASAQGKLGVHVGGNPQIIRGTVPKEQRQRRFRRSDSPLKADRIFQKDNGKCHWCQTPLQRDHPGPDFFQVDHVVAIRDGGGNEESNLVAACALCNHKRARHDPTPTELGSDEIRPQPPEAKKQNLRPPLTPPPSGGDEASNIISLGRKAAPPPAEPPEAPPPDREPTAAEIEASRKRQLAEIAAMPPPLAAAVRNLANAFEHRYHGPGRWPERAIEAQVEEVAPRAIRPAHLTGAALAAARAACGIRVPA